MNSVTQLCPQKCRYRSGGSVPFCGFCMMKILGKEDEMQMMMEESERSLPAEREAVEIGISDMNDLRKLAEHIPDGVVMSINLEEVTADGQEAK